ncbi:TRAP transporter large permease [Fodinicurvata sediminis]|uniref:TRAP transporter large permease n=1 Tax=Fodinicurvata sediminis TaxID=1121832 RepID=UPI0003B5DBD3|nr:TRAP transporter large permease subunit [Fodinicurvata sediminis]
MDPLLTSALVVLLILFLLSMGLWVFASLLLVSMISLFVFADFSLSRIGLIMEPNIWNAATTWELSAIPLFIWMGELFFKTQISEQLFRGLLPWAERVPGRLLHTNVAGSSLFAAVSGSSTATTATVGKITLSALRERGYSDSLSVGSLAGAGSLGILIPPSIPMIVYGIQAEVSISRLFLAGLLPGLLLAIVFGVYIMIISTIRPGIAPSGAAEISGRWFFRSIIDLAPILSLIFVIMGAIYTGFATPSEAAALGLFAAILLLCIMRQLTGALLISTLVSAVKTSCMIGSILISASFLSAAFGLLHIPVEVAQTVAALDLSPVMLLICLSLVYIFLGCLLDGISMIVMTLPVVLPLVINAGFDPIWFGVYLMIMIELAMITPPIGFNLFVIQALSGRSIAGVARSAAPFFFLMVIVTALLVAIPEIAMGLPELLMGR